MRTLAVAVLALLLGPFCRFAEGAEPSATNLESARALYKAGREAERAGDHATALERYRLADSLAHTPITARELGLMHVALGHLVEGREVLLSIARIPVSAFESDKATEARAQAAKAAEDVRPRICTVVVEYKNLAPGLTPIVLVNGSAMPEAAAMAPLKVNPGRQRIVAEVEAVQRSGEIALAEGETRRVQLDFTGVLKRLTPGESRSKVFLYGGFGTAALGVVVGAATGIAAFATASKLSCPENECAPAQHGALSTSRTLGNVSTASFILAGVGAAVGLGAIVLQPKRTGIVKAATAPLEFGVSVHPTGAALLGWF